MTSTPDATRFRETLASEGPAYEVTLQAEQLDGLVNYYELLLRWNSRAHLVAPCTPEEFATRHVLESLLLLKYLPANARVVEVGSGGGLPMMPCLIVRPDVTAVLFEISQKKAVFLREVLIHCSLTTRARVSNERFEDTIVPPSDVLTCRALERFELMLPHLLSWSPPGATLVLFGAKRLAGRIENLGFSSIVELIPRSKARFIYVIKKPLA